MKKFSPLLVFAFIGVIFWADLQTPPGYIEWMAYVLPIILTIRSRSLKMPFIVAAVSTAFIIAGAVLSPSGGIRLEIALLIRLLGILLGWAIAIVIAQKIRADLEVHESEEKERTVLNNIDEVIYMAKADVANPMTGTVEFVSGRVKAIFGYTADDFKRNPHLWSSILHPDDQEQVYKQTKEIYTTKRTGTRVYRIKAKKNGQFRWVEDRIVPQVDEKGKLIGIFGVARDITERKRGEEELHKLFSAVEQTVNCVYITNKDGIIEYVNPGFEKTTGYAKEEAIGKTPRILKSGKHDHKFYEELWTTILSGRVFYAEFINRKKSGELVYQEETITAIRDAEGNITHFIATGRDVTERKRTEEALRQSEMKYRQVVQNAADLIFALSLDGRFILANDAALKLSGYALNELSHYTYLDLIEPAYRIRLKHHYMRQYLQRQPASYVEYPFRTKFGAVRWLGQHATLNFDKGEPDGYHVIARDITERKRAEEALRESEQRYRSLFENMLEGYAYCKILFDRDKPQDFVYIEVNNAFEKLTGLKNVVGKKVSEVIPGIKESNPELFEIYAKVALTGKPERFETYVESLGIWFSIAVYSPGKEYFIAIFDNITERKLAEEALQQSEYRYRELFETTNDLIQAASPDGKFLYVNRAWHETLGYTDEEIVKLSVDDVIHPNSREQCQATLRRVMAGENVSRIETVFLSKDGTLVTVEGSVFCKYEEGRPVSIACILRDITERKRAEDALKLFRTLIDRSNDAIEVLDPETGRFLDINEKACLDLGYSREEFLALSVFDIDPTLDPPFFTRAREELRKSGTLLWEGVHRRKDGSTFPVEVNIKYVQLDRDYIVTVVRDITERKRAEEKNRLLAHTIESISEIASITDLEDRFTFVNKAFLETYGYALEEVVGQHVGILRSPNIPSGLYDEIPDQSRKGGWKGEILNMTKDGREFPLSLRTSPIKDEKGTLIGLVGIAEDITERKRAEKALRQSEEQYRIFFEDDLTGDYISTPDGKILACNPAFVRIFGFASVEEALKINASTLYAVPEKRERFLTLLREKKRLEYVETEHIRSDGTKLYGVENAIGIFDAQGNLTQIRGYLFDDTKRKLLEQQLFQAQKLESLGTLAGGIAHDFNNILGIIMGHASLLERLSAEPHVISRNTEAITKAAMRGAALVRQLLTFARKTDVLIETVLLNDMVNEVSELLAETFPKTITISLHIDKDLPPIVADATQLHQVLLNLCVNARDAMPNGGTLTITTQRQPGEMIRARFPKATEREYIKLSVADTGVGMDEATRTRIFEPFFTTKERGKGTGLGLSLVFGIVESHNGFIAVDSAPGKGTMFELFFPVLEKPAELKQAKEEPTEDIPGGNETILFVEDEKMLRDLVNAFLVAKGYTVLTAADGNEAVVLYQQHKEEIQLVILDMNLPKFNGYEVFHRLKTANRTVKVILASGYLEFDMKSKMLKAGVKDFIQKPYSPHEMLRRIRSLLDNA